MTFTVLGLGSNRSFCGKNPLELLSSACAMLKPLFSSGFCVSSVYLSKAMYVENQDDFHNMCVAGFTELSAFELLSKIHGIEAELGRNREKEIRNGPRSIDIDIELFGSEKIGYVDKNDKMKNLEIPHPRLSERAFVLIPLLELFEVSPEIAEIYEREKFENFLKKSGNQGVHKILDWKEFIDLMEKVAGEKYGKPGGRISENGKSKSGGSGGCAGRF